MKSMSELVHPTRSLPGVQNCSPQLLAFLQFPSFCLTTYNDWKKKKPFPLPSNQEQSTVGVALPGNSLNRKNVRTTPTVYTRPTDAVLWKKEESQGFGQRRKL